MQLQYDFGPIVVRLQENVIRLTFKSDLISDCIVGYQDTGTHPLTRFFGPDKNRVIGEPR